MGRLFTHLEFMNRILAAFSQTSNLEEYSDGGGVGGRYWGEGVFGGGLREVIGGEFSTLIIGRSSSLTVSS